MLAPARRSPDGEGGKVGATRDGPRHSAHRTAHARRLRKKSQLGRHRLGRRGSSRERIHKTPKGDKATGGSEKHTSNCSPKRSTAFQGVFRQVRTQSKLDAGYSCTGLLPQEASGLWRRIAAERKRF